MMDEQLEASERYLELLKLQKEERKANPKLAEIGTDGYCPRTHTTQDLEAQWAKAGMPGHV